MFYINENNLTFLINKILNKDINKPIIGFKIQQ